LETLRRVIVSGGNLVNPIRTRLPALLDHIQPSKTMVILGIAALVGAGQVWMLYFLLS
jgi:hypothetical protein